MYSQDVGVFERWKQLQILIETHSSPQIVSAVCFILTPFASKATGQQLLVLIKDYSLSRYIRPVLLLPS